MILNLLLVGTLAQETRLPEPVRIVRDIQVAIDRDGGSDLERVWRGTLARQPSQPQAILAVATFERARYRYERADTLYQRLQTRDDPAWRAMAQLGMGLWRALGTEPARGDSLFVEARATARAGSVRPVEAEAVLGLAQLRQRTRGIAVGQALLDEWWTLLDRPLARDSAQRLCLTGSMDEQKGDTTGSRRIYEGAVMAERVASWRIAGTCHLALAQSAERRGFIEGARDAARQALAHFARIRYELGTALASQWYGYVLVQSSNFADGRELLERAIVAARATRFTSVEAWAHSGLAELHLTLGDLGQARHHAQIAAASHEARGDRWGVAVSRRFEGQAHEASGDLPTALARYADAQAAFVAAGLPHNALPVIAARVAVLMRLGLLDSAERVILSGATLGRTAEGWRNEQLVLRSVLAMHRGQLAAADSLIRTTQSSKDWRLGGARLTSVTVALREAQLALRRDRVADAEVALAAVSRALNVWRRSPDNVGVTSSLPQLRDNWGGLSDVFPDVMAQLTRLGRTELAFEFMEGIRARDIVERTLRAVALLTDSSLAARALRPKRAAGTVVTVRELQRSLAVDEAFVSYTLGLDDAATTAIIVTRDSIWGRLMPGRSALLTDIRRFSQVAAAGTEAATAGRQLGSALLAPVFSVLPASITRLIVSPDGDLHRVPFDALRLPDGRFALERAAFSVAPSATTLHALRALPATRGQALLAFGDPRYSTGGDASEDANPSRASGSSPFGGVRLPRLRYSGVEAERVGRYGWRPRVLLGRAASEDAVRAIEWSEVGVVHFATHALVDEESQVGTALALTPGARTDGFLTAGEVALLALQGPLVVLSACRSSGGLVLGGEGLRGLTGPLLEAGARAVVATHWSIGDRSVVPFVDRFYAAMATGLRVDEALRHAKLAAIRSGVSIADWASYSVTGDGSIRPALRQPALAPVAWLRNVAQAQREPNAR